MGERRLAFYMHSMFGGGAERVFALVASALARGGRAIDLVLNRAEGPNMAFIDSAVRVIDLQASTAMAPLRLTRYLATERPAALAAGLNNNNVIALFAGRLTGTPVLATVHHLDAQHGADRQTLTLGGWIFNASGPLIYRCADALGGVSQMVVDTLPRGRRAPTVLYNPVDLVKFTPAPERPPGPPLALAVGRVTKVKNFALFVHALARLSRQMPVRGAVLGEGPERAAVTALAADLGLGAAFEAPGYVEDPTPWYQRASVVVSTSRMEGFGNTMIEAMACGAPVVAADYVGPFREVLGPFAEQFLAPPDDPDGIAERMAEAILFPPSLAALRANAARFELHQCAQNYADVLDALAAGGRGRR